MLSSRPYGVVLALSLMVISLASTGLSAQNTGKKVALVLGNSAYTKIQALANPANDASDMAAALARMGFMVLSKTDLDRRAMRGLIDDFNKAIQGAEIALFFYSGHGVQLDGENYLVPVNAEVAVPGDVPDECVSLSRITARMGEAGAGTNIIILDACRDNPFMAVSRGIERGLAVVGRKPPESIIVYATAENEKAGDGNGRNGIFTAALLNNIERPDSFADVLLDVKAQVRRDTSEKQKPATYENLSHRVYLAGGQAAAPTTSGAHPASKPTLTVTQSFGALNISTATAGTLFLDVTPMGDLLANAKAQLKSVEAGYRFIELRHADGHIETRIVEVKEGQTAQISFTYDGTQRAGKIEEYPPMVIEHKGSSSGVDYPMWLDAALDGPKAVEKLPGFAGKYIIVVKEENVDLIGAQLAARNSAAQSIPDLIAPRAKAIFAGARLGDKDKIETYMERAVKSASEAISPSFAMDNDWWAKVQTFTSDGKPNKQVYRIIQVWDIDKASLEQQVDKILSAAATAEPQTSEK